MEKIWNTLASERDNPQPAEMLKSFLVTSNFSALSVSIHSGWLAFGIKVFFEAFLVSFLCLTFVTFNFIYHLFLCFLRLCSYNKGYEQKQIGKETI